MKTAHDYYFMPFLPLIFIVVALGFQQFAWSSKQYVRYAALGIVILSPVIGYTRMNPRWNEEKPGFNIDLYTYHDEIRSVLPDTALTVTGNDVSKYIWPYYLDTKGWTFLDNKITKEQLDDYIQNGAQFLITDMTVQNLKKLQLTESEMQVFGSIRVIKLSDGNKK